MSLANLISGGLLDFLGKILDKAIPDPEQKAKAQALLMQQALEGDIKKFEAEISIMLAEAKSTDPWTSRARPSFLYIMYLMILVCIPMGILYAITPDSAKSITDGVNAWLAAIPEALWWLFGAGYLGYTTARTVDKGMSNGNGLSAVAAIGRKGRK